VWRRVIASSDVPGRAIVPVEVDGDDAVVWRDRDGRPRAVARWCPHLDWDLTEAIWCGDELLCAGHGWSIFADGRACKRNEHGRVDDKGTTRVWTLREHDGWIEAATTAPSP
jgi:phenylpropionate dioxygenase-like ring-hydroxylating dioxygenase large terminal subunit